MSRWGKTKSIPCTGGGIVTSDFQVGCEKEGPRDGTEVSLVTGRGRGGRGRGGFGVEILGLTCLFNNGRRVKNVIAY